jgi:septum formation protein
MKLFLASTSPRRQHLMKEIGFDFEVVRPDTDEIEKKGESPQKMVERFASEKAMAAIEKLKDSYSSGVLISADTTVVSPDKKSVLNKPTSTLEAVKMLKAISGKTHTVLTGYVICEFKHGKVKRWHIEVVRTLVKIRKLRPKEIADYIKTGEPMDKAGSYGAQGIGMCLIEEIRGSYSNVVGLPMTEVVRDLEKKFGLKPRWKT